MSFISRFFGKSPATTATPAPQPELPAPAESPARVDADAQARQEESAVAQAIAAGDMAAVGRWVLEGHSSRIRQQAAEAISDLEQLHELIRATRHGKDKKVYRLLTARRDELLEQDRKARQLESDVAQAAAAIAGHAQRAFDASFAATLERLELRWNAVAAHAAPELRDEVARQLEVARETIEDHRRAEAVQAERERAEALAAEEAMRQQVLEQEAAAAAAAEEARRLEAERRAEEERHAAERAEVRSLMGLLRQAQAALEQGGSARAARLRDAIVQRLSQAPALPPWFARQLEQVESRLKDLEDWKTFRVAPKRAELLERMQGLVGADMSPEELARRIRQLREEWRSLDRGAGHDPAPESPQFEQAAEQAYAPCREHFARQAGLRRENQARREALLERLAAFAEAQSGEQPDWPAIRQVVFEAREEWRQYAPVDPEAVKPLQARFHELLDPLRSRLEAEYGRNMEAKRALVARAAGLVDVEDTRAAIAEAKELQRAWRAVGIVPRRDGNALWDEFRRHCDAVFQRSSQEAAAQVAALEAQHAQAVGLCEELERIAGLDGEELTAGLQQVGELRARFESLELPRPQAKELLRRFGRATGRCDEALRRRRAAAERQGWTDLFAAASKVRACLLATIGGRAEDEREALRADAESAVAGLEQAPRGTRAILEEQLAAASAGALEADLVANAKALRLLCVRAELAAGLDTPVEDADLRREYQMQRLVQSMAHGERDAPADFGQFAREWLAVGPVEPAEYEILWARFERCRDAL